ncbi:hydrogenase [Fervidicella metallireducens AeB]|uniref:Hydrogenase n=1 Tax=Fervidicella metallireducens AeB TaxID=1403537 RepID=A0A017RWR6_9CLOT|nr:hydrogenase expression/formation protein HypE [Fervidicella metallireducens]EYE88380.1 hydrogenase [Fervidicella metallireducens AeB]
MAVCGTINDICMCGGEPKYLSLSFIIEEGFKTEDLRQIVNSIKKVSEECNVIIATGDTKVVERGKGDGIYINTAGIGFLKHENLGKERIQKGDVIIVSGTMGDHGTAIMAARNNLITGIELFSDCAPLNNLAEEILSYGDKVKILRDPTRGGLATTLNEFVEGTDMTIELEEDRIPIKNSVANACEIIGLDPLYAANEGKIVAVVAEEVAERLIESMKKLPEGRDSAIIGRVTSNYPGKVIIKTQIGGNRILGKLAGAQLPRIC